MMRLMDVCPDGSIQHKTNKIKALWRRLSRGPDVDLRVVLQWLVDFNVAPDLERASAVVDAYVGKRYLAGRIS